MLKNIDMLNIIINHKWLLISAFFSALTVTIVKFYETNKNIGLLALALASETGLIYGYVQILTQKDILTDFALVKIISILFLFLPSIYFFGTKLTKSKILGLILASISMYLLN